MDHIRYLTFYVEPSRSACFVECSSSPIGPSNDVKRSIWGKLESTLMPRQIINLAEQYFHEFGNEIRPSERDGRYGDSKKSGHLENDGKCWIGYGGLGSWPKKGQDRRDAEKKARDENNHQIKTVRILFTPFLKTINGQIIAERK